MRKLEELSRTWRGILKVIISSQIPLNVNYVGKFLRQDEKLKDITWNTIKFKSYPLVGAQLLISDKQTHRFPPGSFKIGYLLWIELNFLLLVFLEHEHIDSFLNEMTHQTEDLTGGKTFFCGICQKNSKAKQDIERHIETHHIQTNPFQCGICGYVSKSRRYFKVHLRSHKTR